MEDIEGFSTNLPLSATTKQIRNINQQLKWLGIKEIVPEDSNMTWEEARSFSYFLYQEENKEKSNRRKYKNSS